MVKAEIGMKKARTKEGEIETGTAGIETENVIVVGIVTGKEIGTGRETETGKETERGIETEVAIVIDLANVILTDLENTRGPMTQRGTLSETAEKTDGKMHMIRPDHPHRTLLPKLISPQFSQPCTHHPT